MVTGKSKKPESNFKAYLRSVFKKSLIPSFPEIASSRDWRRRWLKACVFVISFIGFAYQTTQFLQLYLTYPTVIDIQVTIPTEVEQPAFTICNSNKRRRTIVCKKPECKCKEDDFLVSFCFNYPNFCPNEKSPVDVYEKVALSSAKDEYPCVNIEKRWEEAVAESHTNNTIFSCMKSSSRMPLSDCKRPYQRIPVRETNHPYGVNICYTIESQVGNSEAQPTFHDNMFQMKLVLRLHEEEYLDYMEWPSVLIAVHNQKDTVNPYQAGYLLKGGMRYGAFVSLTEEKYLPSPYDTQCVDYMELWRKRNGTGPLNRKMCIEYCKMMHLMQKGECMDHQIHYPHEEPICETSTIKMTEVAVQNCTKLCRTPCLDKIFDVKYAELSEERLKNEDGKEILCGVPDYPAQCKGSIIQLEVYFSKYTLTTISHTPKFDSSALFSYLGGIVGIWIGLSLVSLFDLLETLICLAYYLVKRKTSQSRTMRRKNIII